MQTIVLLPVWPEHDIDQFTVLLEKGQRSWQHVGAEIRVSIDEWDTAAKAVDELRAAGFTVAIHLPPVERFRPEEGLVWLKEMRPNWAVVHGGTADNGEVISCADFLEFLRERADRLKILAASGVPICVENAPPREPVRDPFDPGMAVSIRSLIRAGMFARDLLFLARKAGCGVVADTEHLLDAIVTVRERTKKNGYIPLTTAERDFADRFGFVIQKGEVLWSEDYLYNPNLQDELSILRPKRFHITGSWTTVLDGMVTSHAEIKDNSFGRYLIRLVLSYHPLSVTVESCHERGQFNFSVLERSFLFVLKMLKERSL